MADEPQEIQAGAVELLTTQQICDRLQISQQTFRRLRKKENIPVHILGRRSHRYDPVEVLRVVDRLRGTE